MDKVEEIRAEIERLKEDCASPMVICDTLLSLIDSFKEEPISNDLEEIAKEIGLKYFPDEENIWARGNIEAKRCKMACIEMAKWQKEQIIRELEMTISVTEDGYLQHNIENLIRKFKEELL